MKKVSLVILLIVCNISLTVAQQKSKTDKSELRELRNELNCTLSAEQKAQLQFQKKLRQQHLRQLKVTFSDQQYKIVENKELSRYGKRMALQPLLNEAQKKMISAHKESMKAERTKLITTFTAE
ncbi:hypothetical protein [Aquimarina brevivitae]|uniref:LTXXQ motif family protein n=1 Tax=Aquimarina brevivitae TaxID=323412 RepID=A0A4V2F5L1_9FLAO|nr:hypothetical protein [Aquimarina brevivitae]RZS93199.1 hypothetical protein EV197_1770 [Aquimarina brevivitae]